MVRNHALPRTPAATTTRIVNHLRTQQTHEVVLPLPGALVQAIDVHIARLDLADDPAHPADA
ncbi:hypothetical protein [Streptomyces sp. MS2.AVA.5]|uniref:Uncharacterized protein n=1 Tax=Streptomyces achmelvichensis TaxID=3134111 RepID=A0ACC6PKW8_9ACTN